MLPSERYDSLIRYWTEQAGLDFTLIKRQIAAESAFDPAAMSRVGALGLAQFMPGTWGDAVKANNWPAYATPLDPEYAIRALCWYMQLLLKRYKGNYKLALAAYNWGMGNVSKHPGMDDWPKETRDYVERIMP